MGMNDKPMAVRMRPKTMDEVLGQNESKRFLNNLIENKKLISMVMYGPPGCGKTTLAYAFANTYGANCIKLNAVSDNKARMEQAFGEATRFSPTIVIIDEIHRLDKPKQDLLLPHLEDGDFYIIGCTTSNPLISLSPAIRSRTRLLECKPLGEDDVYAGLKRALESKEGLDNTKQFEDDGLRYLAKISGGDLRFAYNQLEAISLSYSKDHVITLEDCKEVAPNSNYYADQDENEHYDTVSALQKSIRGSDPDAAVYYLSKLIKSGDMEGLIRRLLVTAYEDVGLANPPAVDRCLNACNTAREVGFPEGAIPLAFTVIDLALSPKSKSADEAVLAALDCVDEYPLQVREYLKLTRANVDEEDKYPYDRKDVWPLLKYLPEEIEDMKFYHPYTTGKYERALKENYEKLCENRKASTIKEGKALADEKKKK